MRRKWTIGRVKSLLRRVEPHFSTSELNTLRDLLTAQIVRDRFVAWGWDSKRIAESLGISEASVVSTIRDLARKARV